MQRILLFLSFFLFFHYGFSQKIFQDISTAAGIAFTGANSLNLHFGLGEYNQVQKATNSQKQELFNLAANQTYQIIENQAPVLHSIVVVDSIIEKHGKFETNLELTATYDNPYDFDQITVSAVFKGPSGQEKTVDGFFMKDYRLNTVNGNITAQGSEGFKVRFSPDELGEWFYQISATDVNGTTTFETQKFQCVVSNNPNNKGFIRTGASNYLEFDNGEQYILVGQNMAWQNNNPYTSYLNWLNKLKNHKGNFFRLWHAHWGLGIEWKNGWQNFEGLRKYKESNAFYQDWLFDFCADNGIYVMLALQHHGQVSSQVNPNWGDNPYNASNGGPCQSTWEFFKDSTALAHTKNRLRYIMARWGYSRSIMAWELFNEVEWTDDYEAHKLDIRDWHTEMAGYLKEHDPYNHIVTTSYAHEDQDPFVWANPDMDITQTHFYINTSNIERALAGGVRSYLEKFEKPTLTGEFGLGGTPNLSNEDPDGIHLHNGLWGALFGGGLGTAMSWWWDQYVHPRDLYYHFDPVSKVAEAVPFVKENMSPATSYVLGAPGDLALTPNLGWGIAGDEAIIINDNGTTTPANPKLGQFLYGSSWNTPYRSPPSFSVTYPEEGRFTVKTNTDKGTSPKISIYLNGSLVLNEDAAVNETYSILVPPGPNLIKVDNLGTDWITIASYSFSGVGSKVDTYTLTSENKKVAAGWILNHAYNHQFIDENGEPEIVPEGEVVIEDFADGDYFVKWYDCLTGNLMTSEQVTAVNKQLFLPISNLLWDMAFLVDEEAVSVSTSDQAQQLAFNIYPNPITAGEPLNLQLPEGNASDIQVSILDASGRELQKLREGTTELQEINLPANLPTGFYWLRVESEGMVGTKPFVLGR